jgi:hypothetical protein
MHHELLLVYAGDTFTGEHGRKGAVLVPVVSVSTAPVPHGNSGQLGHVSNNPLLDVARWNVWRYRAFNTSVPPPFRDILVDIFCH